MVDFLGRRLQVFVSSTFADLQPQRQAAVEAILTAGHIPAGMELFTSGDESQMDVIKQWIDESDIYLLILGGRYGSIEPKSGKSYTHVEYEYAVERGKALFSCIVKEAAHKKRVKQYGVEFTEQDNPKQLKEFRAVAASKMCRFWDDSKDIKITILETLAHFARRDDMVGWVRPSQVANMPALTDEVARLSAENARLREANPKAEEPRYGGLRYEEMKNVLHGNGMLNTFYDLRQNFHASGRVSDSDMRDLGLDVELLALGLVMVNDRYSDYRVLTEPGRAFLNRLEADGTFDQQSSETS